MNRLPRLSLLLLALVPCTAPVLRGQSPAPDSATPPPFMIGQFVDDYGNRFSITPTEFAQLPRARYHVHAWHVADQYLVARNDPANPGDGGRWTRIDWLQLEGMAPYTWAFCFSVYDAATPEAAAAVTIARRDSPRTGCNGFPFSRMSPATD